MGNTFDSKKRCEAAALFMHDMSPANSVVIFYILMFGIPLLCFSMSKIAKDLPPKKKVCSPTSKFQSKPSQDAAKTASSTAKEEPPELSSAASFVLGSAIFLCICTMLFILALCIQRFAYCPQYNSNFWVMIVVLWFLFAGQALAGCYAAGCWLVLLRDLWGQRGRELVPVQTFTVVVAVLTGIFAPFVMVGVGLVAGVRKFQEVCGVGEFEGGNVELDEQTVLASDKVASGDSETMERFVKVD